MVRTTLFIFFSAFILLILVLPKGECAVYTPSGTHYCKGYRNKCKHWGCCNRHDYDQDVWAGFATCADPTKGCCDERCGHYFCTTPCATGDQCIFNNVCYNPTSGDVSGEGNVPQMHNYCTPSTTLLNNGDMSSNAKLGIPLFSIPPYFRDKTIYLCLDAGETGTPQCKTGGCAKGSKADSNAESARLGLTMYGSLLDQYNSSKAITISACGTPNLETSALSSTVDHFLGNKQYKFIYCIGAALASKHIYRGFTHQDCASFCENYTYFALGTNKYLGRSCSCANDVPSQSGTNSCNVIDQKCGDYTKSPVAESHALFFRPSNNSNWLPPKGVCIIEDKSNLLSVFVYAPSRIFFNAKYFMKVSVGNFQIMESMGLYTNNTKIDFSKPACPLGWTDLGIEGGEKCYRHFPVKVTYFDAQHVCETKYNGTLASPTSAEEMNAINEKFTYYYIWIPFTDENSEGVWKWDTGGTDLFGASWQSGQPNGGSSENCCVMKNKILWDVKCSSILYMFMCEINRFHWMKGDFDIVATTCSSDSCSPNRMILSLAPDSICKDCPPGMYVETSCSACQAGKYGDQTNQTMCKDCPAGQYGDQIGQTVCYETPLTCSPGYYKIGTVNHTCEVCPPGKFSATPNQAKCMYWSICDFGSRIKIGGTNISDRTCEGCPNGTFSSSESAVHCTPHTVCGSGQRIEASGNRTTNTICIDCPNGQYLLANANNCTNYTTCNPGEKIKTSATVASDRTCEGCPNGTFSSSENAVLCTPHTVCGSGQRIEASGNRTTNTICIDCPNGQYLLANANNCTNYTTCNPGEKIKTSATVASDRTCEGCPTGTFSSSENSKHCMPHTTCNPGQRIKASGSITSNAICIDCPNGQYSLLENSNNCTNYTTCNPGEKIKTSATVASDRVCEECPNGTFSSSENAAYCTPHTVCDSGQRMDASGNKTMNALCIDCPFVLIAPRTYRKTCHKVTRLNYVWIILAILFVSIVLRPLCKKGCKKKTSVVPFPKDREPKFRKKVPTKLTSIMPLQKAFPSKKGFPLKGAAIRSATRPNKESFQEINVHPRVTSREGLQVLDTGKEDSHRSEENSSLQFGHFAALHEHLDGDSTIDDIIPPTQRIDKESLHCSM